MLWNFPRKSSCCKSTASSTAPQFFQNFQFLDCYCNSFLYPTRSWLASLPPPPLSLQLLPALEHLLLGLSHVCTSSLGQLSDQPATVCSSSTAPSLPKPSTLEVGVPWVGADHQRTTGDGLLVPHSDLSTSGQSRLATTCGFLLTSRRQRSNTPLSRTFRGSARTTSRYACFSCSAVLIVCVSAHFAKVDLGASVVFVSVQLWCHCTIHCTQHCSQSVHILLICSAWLCVLYMHT